ncbi:transposable element Tcb2 transposase [Trichonephila clavipes]|nr:transposable element Tcb2 transposase [Trichonephila clavipes]
MWTVTDRQKFVFSDESRFVLGTDDNRVRVWRRPGERYNSPHTILRHTARTAGVMVSKAIAYDSRAIFQQDIARPHTPRVAQDFLRHFQTLPWPARSPDSSPVEHVGDEIKRQMPSCNSLHDLEWAVQDLWAHLPQDNIRSRFCLRHQDSRIRVWWHRGERTLTACICHRYSGRSPGIMIWGAIGYTSRPPFVRIDDTLNSARYISGMLQPVALFFIRVMPARSPDLSPIQNVWSMVAKRLARYHTTVTTFDELWYRV